MTYRYHFILLSLFGFIWNTSSQSFRHHEINITGGYVEYMHPVALPFGMPGAGSGLSYRGIWEKETTFRHGIMLDVDLQYLCLQRKEVINELNSPYQHGELKIGGYWQARIPISSSLVEWDMGTGLSFHAMGGYNFLNLPYASYYTVRPYGSWYTAADIYSDLRFKHKDWTFGLRLELPLLVGGMFEEYQSSPSTVAEAWKQYTLPNTLIPFWNFFDLHASLSAQYTFTSAKRYRHGIRLAFNYQALEAFYHNNRERKQFFGLSVGWVMMR